MVGYFVALQKRNLFFNLKSKHVNNRGRNIWNSTKTKAKISANGLQASDNTNEWVNVYAVKGFDISGQHSRKDNNFHGTIVYYYEVTQIDYAFYYYE
jgi:hypothetical protein